METLTSVLAIVLATAFFLSGLAKIVGVEAIEAGARALGITRRLHLAAATLEMAAAVGLIVGLWWVPLGLAAAIGLTIMMGIAVAYHVRAKDKPANTAAPAALGLLSLLAAVLSVSTGI